MPVKIAAAFQAVRLLFLDTAPIIYHVEGTAAYQPRTDWVFRNLQNGAFQAAASPITLAECLVVPYRQANTLLIQLFHKAVFSGVHTTFVSLDGCADRAAELRARYNLTMTDAFQVAAALAASCDAFLTNDLGLKRVTELTMLVLDELEM
jgi:predicted nucleic acid-binding protein